jgi:hypothetical protein
MKVNEEIRTQIVETKRRPRADRGAITHAFSQVEDAMKAQADAIQTEVAAGRSPIPEIDYATIREGTVSEHARERVRERGAVVVRGVFPRTQAEQWNDELGDYITANGYYRLAEERRGLDNYFSQLDSGRPQIFGIYWSKPQVQARQGESMAATKRFLNHLWQADGPEGREFDPDNDCAYADRTRRREPGDRALGLSPHMDAGSHERWVDPAHQRIYAPVFAGAWRQYDPWSAADRTRTKQYPSPAMCSMFRTFQGWTALTPQGPHDGTLQLVPIADGIAYMLLRALLDDVPDDQLCDAEPGRALGASPEWHPARLEALVSIPLVEPGDTVWWHPDVVHAVENEHAGTGYSNVIYVGASPRCPKNVSYLERQAAAFLEGRSAPDFASEDYEINFAGRATLDDLTDLGRAQMGL